MAGQCCTMPSEKLRGESNQSLRRARLSGPVEANCMAKMKILLVPKASSMSERTAACRAGEGADDEGDGRDADHDADGGEDRAGFVGPDLSQSEENALVNQEYQHQWPGGGGFRVAVPPWGRFAHMGTGRPRSNPRKPVRSLISDKILAIFHAYNTMSMGCDVGFVGDDDDFCLASAVQFFKKREDFIAGFGVEIAGRFVSEKDGRVVDQGASNGDALFLAAGELIGAMLHALREADAI